MPPGTKLPKSEVERRLQALRKAAATGQSLWDAAGDLGISPPALYVWLRKRGGWESVSPDGSPAKRGGHVNRPKYARIVELALAGRTNREICNAVGCSIPTALKAIREAGITRPPRPPRRSKKADAITADWRSGDSLDDIVAKRRISWRTLARVLDEMLRSHEQPK